MSDHDTIPSPPPSTSPPPRIGAVTSYGLDWLDLTEAERDHVRETVPGADDSTFRRLQWKRYR